MATASDIIKGALRHLGIIEDEEPIEASMLQDGLEDLNDWGALYEASSLSLGFTRLDAVTDTINIPVEAEGFYKLGLAEYIGPQYGEELTPAKITNKANMEEMLLRTFAPVIEVEYPDSLPMGSGNYDGDTDRFFTNNEDVNF